MASSYANRSVSMMASGDGPHNRAANGTASNVAAAVTDAPLTVHRTSDSSPLQIFVKAKKKINDIFVDIEGYVVSTCEYMHSLDPEVASATTVERVGGYTAKVNGIRDVLTRDHMKVAFFGRTSNGKSTVINAMLRDKVLPSGIGHTTNCFLQVEGSDTSEAYLVTEQSPTERQNVHSVAHLAHALCKEKLNESQLVRVYWPRDKCLLLRDDVVFVDSPGVDVTPNLDEWIDKHCLDADVFVLVANAESTLMVTEKNFFHKVSTKLSKPNIFILNNRWDASANEPEFLEQVRRQHQERALDFLVRELKVCDSREAEERIFFVSAKEALYARIAEQNGSSMPLAALADGFQSRYFEFQDFERRFEECISKSAVRTKFAQHGERGRAIVGDVRTALDEVFMASHASRERLVERRLELRSRLDHTEQQLMHVTGEMKDKIRRMVEDVEQRVSRALNEEIRRLAVLVDEFSVPFHPEPLVLNVYKRELHGHVELGLGSNLRARLSTALAMNMEQSQREMVDRMEKLLLPIVAISQATETVNAPKALPSSTSNHNLNGAGSLVTAAGTVLPRRQPFEILYRLNCDNLCADFHEDLEFRFSWGITSLVQRFTTSRVCHRLALKDGSSQRVIPQSPVDLGPQSLPGPVVTTGPPVGITPEDWSLLSKVALASVSGSQGTVGGLFVAGFLLKTVGWRLIVITGGIYSCLYLYERLTWTNKAKERLFKRQYVQHATKKLRMIVDLTSANCSHQVQQELSGTFARLCHLVDEATDAMDRESKQLDEKIRELETAAADAKVLKNKANYISHELDLFEDAYLKAIE